MFGRGCGVFVRVGTFRGGPTKGGKRFKDLLLVGAVRGGPKAKLSLL